MKSLLKACFLIGLVLAFLIPRTVNAQDGVDYVADAIVALQTSNVYVALGTPGTGYDTPSRLSKLLIPGDNIVLVMFPLEALSGTDLYTMVRRISEGLGDQKTVGLAVGREVIGYSAILPDGVANDKMNRANTVASDAITALTIFTQNIHSWQVYNPQPTPVPTPKPTPTPRPTMEPIELPKIDTSTTSGKVSTVFIWLVVVVVLGWLGIKLIPRIVRFSKFTPASKTLTTIEGLLGDIENRRVVTELDKACKLAHGLIKIYRSSPRYTGKGEDLFPIMLGNILRQIQALIVHEDRSQPLADEVLSPMLRTLLNYDDLFAALQKNDPETIELIAANYMSENTMISHLGYLRDK